MDQQKAEDCKLLLEMAIHELCIAQEKITDVYRVIHAEIHPRITQALSNLDEAMASQAMEMDEATHHTFLNACRRATILQKEMDCLSAEPEAQTVSPKKESNEQPSDESENDQENFTLVVPKAQKPLQEPAMQQALTLEQYRSYSQWVYTTQNTNSWFIEFSGKYPRIHFLAGSSPDDVNRAVFYGYCGSITSSPGNREIIGLHKSIIEAVKKFRKTSKSDHVVLKFLMASPEVAPTPALGWMVVQLCTPNKANIKVGKEKTVQTVPEVIPEWISTRRGDGFGVIFKRLQQIRENNKGFMYNAPNNILIYADGNCQPRYDAINKISSAISLINSCRVPGSFVMLSHLCSILHKDKTAGCCICPKRVI
jgi:hypothetical protein